MADARDAAFGIVLAVGDAIKSLGEVPSGHLYAQVMNHLSLEEYTRVIDILKGAKLVEETPAHLLKWIPQV